MRTFLAFFLLVFSCSLFAKEWTKDELLERLTKHVTSEDRDDLREDLWKDSGFPKKLLVEFLSHENPAIRNEAIELLEEVAGGDLGYVPLNNPNSDKTKEAIAQWVIWAGTEQKIKKQAAELTDSEAFRYFTDIMTGDREGFYRSVRRLSPYRLDAVGKIEGFIDSTPQLSEGNIARLKQAQYQLVLMRSNIGSPEVVARELTFGTRDQKLKALNSLKSAGLISVPVIRDFIKDNDALVRETSVDVILEVGGEQVLDFVKPVLDEEKDPNVIHIALRKLKDVGGTEAKKMVGSFLTHENEDIVMSALKVYRTFENNRGYSNGKQKNSEVDKLVLKLLEDKRWRILAAALEYVAKQRLISAEEKVVELLRFDDDFVVANAVKAAVALKSQKALPVLEELLENPDANVKILVEGIVKVSGTLSNKQIETISARGSEAIEALISAHEGSYRYNPIRTKVVSSFVNHENIDVACAALRSLASASSRVQQDFVANHLSDALRSGVEEKISAVLSNLDLPRNPLGPKSLGGSVRNYESQGDNPELNHLYKVFNDLSKHIEENSREQEVETAESSGGLSGMIAALKELTKSLKDEEDLKRIKVLLIEYGDVETLSILAAQVADLEPSEKIAIVNALQNTTSEAGLSALKVLLNDPSAEVRELAAYAFFYEEKNYGLIKEGLEESIKEDISLKAVELYSSQLNYAARERKNSSLFKVWSKKVIESDTISAEKKVIALSLLRSKLSADLLPKVQELTKSENQQIRRAAWHLLAYEGKLSTADDSIKTLLEDKSLLVRMALPMAMNKKISSGWVHYFNDKDTANDSYYDYNSRNRRMSSSLEPILRELAEKDISEQVRYESLFTLLCYGKSIDLDIFTELLVKQPEHSKAQVRLLSFIESNYRTMGKGMGVLIAYLDLRKTSGRTRALIINHFFGEKSTLAFGSFSELSKTIKIIEAEAQYVEEVKDDSIAVREEVKLFYFYEQGCKECARLEKDVLPKFEETWKKSSDVKLTVEWYDIYKPESAQVNRVMANRIGNSRAAGKKPAVISETAILLNRDINIENLMDMAFAVAALPVSEENYEVISEEEKDWAQKEIEKEYNALTLPIIIIAGLIDGINPCAFATIIFFLSYLQVAKRSPKEIFFVGIAFILGVFLAYFSIGLVFHSLIGALTERFAGVKTVLNYVFALVALVVAYFSFMDYLKARKGDLKGMSLQLPGMLKNRVRTVIRKSSKSAYFVAAAFITGIVISFIELACTGQVYLPIIYQVQQGNHDAVFYLLCFNIAFVLPLVIIFGLAMMGMKSAALIDFQQKHTAKIKILFTILFLLLALMLLFNDQVSGWFIELKNMLGLDQLGKSE